MLRLLAHGQVLPLCTTGHNRYVYQSGGLVPRLSNGVYDFPAFLLASLSVGLNLRETLSYATVSASTEQRSCDPRGTRLLRMKQQAAFEASRRRDNEQAAGGASSDVNGALVRHGKL